MNNQELEYKLYQLRLHEDFVDNNKPSGCWHEDAAWKSNRIDAIENKVGVKIDQKIASYPSPLARMYFFHDAFEFVLNHPEMDTNNPTIYHRAVSDCLDVWEIIFYLDIYQKQGVDFYKWDFKKITTLQQNNNEKFRLLGDALNLYLKNDASIHTQSISNIYLITHQGIVFAGTSPYTGFFSASDDISFHLSIQGSNQFYFHQIRMLEDRSEEFQEYMHKFAKNMQIHEHFSHFFKYIQFIGSQSTRYKTTVWASGQVNFDQDYPNPALNQEQQKLILLDHSPTHQKGNVTGIVVKKNEPRVTDECEFFIRSAKLDQKVKQNPRIRRPLVLKTQPEGHQKIYVGPNLWNEEIKVPHYAPEILEDRVLPAQGIKYPWLTISDFLEEYLVKVPYKIDEANFLTCDSPSLNQDFSYLLPIKPKYFEYFDLADLKKHLLVENMDGFMERVEVSLQIPIGKIKSHNTQNTSVAGQEVLVFKRVYEVQRSHPTVDQIQNDSSGKGHIVSYPFGVMIFPFFQTNQKEYNNFYKVACIDGQIREASAQVDLKFYKEEHLIGKVDMTNTTGVSKTSRLTKVLDDREGSDYYEVTNTTFDIIQVDTQPLAGIQAQGLIIPLWKQVEVGTARFSFAVDFGTTNTHVAYTKNDHNPRPFNITEDEMQVVRLDKVTVEGMIGMSETKKYDEKQVDDTSIIPAMIDRQRFEFVPSIFGEEYVFPMRTAIVQSKAHQAEPSLLGNANIPLAFNIRYDQAGGRSSSGTQVFTNLKWNAHGDQHINRIKVFIQEILFLIRNKVLINNGNPSSTRIYWFIPLSMPQYIQNHLSKIWNDEYARIFNTVNIRPVKITESETPYYVHKKQGDFSGNTVLSIDIGGGTTDMLVFKSNDVSMASSCTFAGDVLFGNGNDLTKSLKNGIVRAFSGDVKNKLENLRSAKTDEEQRRYRELELINKNYLNPEKGFNSPDVISFWLSTRQLAFSQNFDQYPEFKIAFLLFYSALFYHFSQMFNAKKEDLGVPSDLCFSGNGSKIMQLISPNLEDIEDIANAIFARTIQNYPKDHRVKIHTIIDNPPHDGPKQATCNGALYSNLSASKFFEGGLEPYLCLGENLQWATPGKEEQASQEKQPDKYKVTYQDLLDATFDLEGSEYKKFIDLFFDLFDQMKFISKFGFNLNAKKVKDYLLSKAAEDFKRGVNLQISRGEGSGGLVPSDEIRETAFFYPIKGAIHGLLDELAKHKLGEGGSKI